MSSFNDQKMQEELKRREYLKQQQQLRNMSKPKNNLSADAMIENLLSKKEIFQKKSSVPSQNQNSNPANVPPMYTCIWEWCRVPGSVELADTNKVSALLMTSRLSTDALGYIWSLANQTVPGSLTQHELYTTLALVALAQSGYSFRSSAVVGQLGRLPLPMLDMSLVSVPVQPVMVVPSSEQPAGLFQPITPQPSFATGMPTSSSAPQNSLKSFNLTQPVNSNPINQTEQGCNEDDDEFDDFKSADLSSLNVDNLRVLEVSSSSSGSSLIRFDSPRRPPPGLSLLDSPSRESPTQLCVLDLPLTETSHQPPFDKPSAFQNENSGSPTSYTPAVPPPEPIVSISSTVDSPAHQVEDLFPRCIIKKNHSVDLLDWDSSPQEDYITCDLTSNKIELTESPPLGLDTMTSQITSELDQIKLESVEMTTNFPQEIETGDVDLDSIKMTESIAERTESSTSGELSLSDFDTKLSNEGTPPLNTINCTSTLSENASSFLDMDDKYSALRELESKPSDDFGDFITAEPVNLLSTPSFSPQTSIQDQCMDAVLALLYQAINSFKTITDERVLTEVLDDPKCKKYLEELGEVYNVGNRLSHNDELGTKSAELETCWSTLAKSTRQALPQIRKLPIDSNDTVRCGICRQNSNKETQISYAMNNFHPSCANLYLNQVSGASLPLQ